MKLGKKSLVITIIASLTILLCFIFDYFNIPTKLGLYVNAINYDLWGIIIGNGVVIALFVITYNLFDKRNLEKERLADYAAAVMILDDYRQCRGLMLWVEAVLETDIQNRDDYSPNMIEKITNLPFKNSEKIFEFLASGHIPRERYDIYSNIKNTYDTLVYQLLSIKEFPRLEQNLYKELVKMLDDEEKTIEAHIKQFNK